MESNADKWLWVCAEVFDFFFFFYVFLIFFEALCLRHNKTKISYSFELSILSFLLFVEHVFKIIGTVFIVKLPHHLS